MSSFKDFENDARLYELRDRQGTVLSNLETLLQEAARKNIQSVLRLKDKLRTEHIKRNPNYRAMILERLGQHTVVTDDTDTMPKELREKKELMEKIAARIAEADQIIAEIEMLERPENGNKPDDDDNGPKSVKSNAA